LHDVRPPAVAGTFYPAESAALEAAVDAYLAAAPRTPASLPKVLIAPHAGYVYSGPIAASAYATIAPLRGVVERVLLIGPAHTVALDGLAAPTWARFDTPLGSVEIDRVCVEKLVSLPQVQLMDQAHLREHSLEVHLPFLQRVLGDFLLVPLVCGNARAEEVAEVLDVAWGGPETLIVISSDLSHYHDYETACELDQATTRAIEALDPGGLGSESACGRIPIRGALLAARRRGLQARTLDLRNSGDTAGPRDRVVGYGAYALV
jgi:AmmeMemoRadiSam system protein B